MDYLYWFSAYFKQYKKVCQIYAKMLVHVPNTLCDFTYNLSTQYCKQIQGPAVCLCFT